MSGRRIHHLGHAGQRKRLPRCLLGLLHSFPTFPVNAHLFEKCLFSLGMVAKSIRPLLLVTTNAVRKATNPNTGDAAPTPPDTPDIRNAGRFTKLLCELELDAIRNA